MATLLVGYAFLLLVVAVVIGALSAYAWSRRDYTGGTALSVLLAGLVIWTTSVAVGILARGSELALVWAHTVFVGVVISVGGLFRACLHW